MQHPEQLQNKPLEREVIGPERQKESGVKQPLGFRLRSWFESALRLKPVRLETITKEKSSAQIVVPDVDPARRTRFEVRLSNLPRSRSARLLAGMAVLEVAVGSADGWKKLLNMFTTDNGLEIQAGETSITVRDYNQPEQWNMPLPNTANVAHVDNNAVYQYHAQIVSEQYERSVRGAPYQPKGEPTIVYAQHGDIEPGRMTAGDYPSYSDLYGSMQVEHPDEIRSELINRWQKTITEEGWGDFDQLDAHQWMQLIQQAGSELQYDFRIASFFPQFDPDLTKEQGARSIDQLLHDGTGVCRDVERLNVTSYHVADETFDLKNRGLLYMTLANSTDAGHARGSFLLATSERTMTAVGIDATNSGGVTEITGGEHTPAEVGAWFTQNVGKEWLDPIATESFYDNLLSEYGKTMQPAAKAIAQRELLAARLQLAEAAEASGNEQSAKVLYQTMFTSLDQQIFSEAVVTAPTKHKFQRLESLSTLLLRLATLCDQGTKQTVYRDKALKRLAEQVKASGLHPEVTNRIISGNDMMTSEEQKTARLALQMLLAK